MHDIEFLELFAVLIKNGFSIQKALDVLGSQKKTEKYAGKIRSSLEKGISIPKSFSSLSSRTKTYESILCAACESGDITPALELMIRELKEKNERKKALIIESAYPVFVLCLAQVLTFLLLAYGIDYLGAIVKIERSQMVKGLIAADLWLLFSSLLLISFCSYTASKHRFEIKLFESLLALIRCEKNLEKLLKTVIQGSDFKERDIKAVSVIIREIRNGQPFYRACRKSGRFDEFTFSCLFVAEESGEVTKSFERIATHYSKKRADAGRMIQKIMESGEILVCGIYILLLVIFCAVPIFENLGSTLF